MTDASRPVMSKSLVDRVKAILMSPKTEWPIIAAEPATVGGIFMGYVLILAAIPAIATFLSMSVIGLGGIFRFGMGAGLTAAIMTYITSLIGVFLSALIIEFLAPTFGGTKDRVQALKAAAYSYTAYWVASIIGVIPFIGWLILFIGLLYSLYLLYLGLPVTMRTPSDKALPYTAVVVIASLVIGFVLSMIVGSMAGTSMMMMGANSVPAITSSGGVVADPNSTLGQLEAFANRMEQANKELEAAQQSGDAQAQQDALGRMFGAAVGGNTNVASLSPDELRPFVPERLNGLPRTDISVEQNAAMGIQVSEARATYGDDTGRSIDLEITDMAGMGQGIFGLAAWANVQGEKQTDTGYERTTKQGNRIIHEAWDNESKSGEYSLILNNRFLVKVNGSADDVGQLRAAANSVDLNRLEGMRAAAR